MPFLVYLFYLLLLLSLLLLLLLFYLLKYCHVSAKQINKLRLQVKHFVSSPVYSCFCPKHFTWYPLCLFCFPLFLNSFYNFIELRANFCPVELSFCFPFSIYFSLEINKFGHLFNHYIVNVYFTLAEKCWMICFHHGASKSMQIGVYGVKKLKLSLCLNN
jgi:hypothetical protein